MKKHLPTILVVLMLFLGLSMLFYPDVATWWNGRNQRGMVSMYDEEVARLGQEQIDQHFQRAAAINAELSLLPPDSPLLLAHQAFPPYDYDEILRVRNAMGHIEIPVINVRLPIFHGTGPDALDHGVGHMEGTSFPIGGESTHSVLTAHTGLANARMFSDMEESVHIGDKFFITILDRRIAYEVYYIETILPHQTESMRIVPGQDIVTLMTCTPYTINTHRLLVRGRRIEYTPYMAETIEQNIVSRGMDVRIYIFVGLFLMFMIVFAVYTVIKGREVAIPKRRRRTANPAHEPNTANLDRNRENTPFIDDPFDIPEIPSPSYMAYKHEASIHAAAIEAERYAYNDETDQPLNKGVDDKKKRSAKPLKPALIGKNAPNKRKPGKNKIPNIARNIAASFIALFIIIGISAAIAQGRSQPSRNGQSVISDFVTMIEDYKADYRYRWVADQIGRWVEGGELTMLDEGEALSPLSWLHNRVIEHNRHLYESGQRNIPDPFDYSQESICLSHFGFESDEGMIGFITIPSIELELPIFMGASRKNLHRGLAHITNTSLPVGGENTNAVIAGHMGLRRTSLLDNIGDVNVGDIIQVTNFYETITYIIAYIFQGSHESAFTIHSGQDLLTLVGYQQGSPERYMVVARRFHQPT